MSKNPFDVVEPFALSPLLALLPSMGGLGKLEALMSSLYARYEKVQLMKGESDQARDQKILAAEEAMLRQVLDWLALTPGGAK